MAEPDWTNVGAVRAWLEKRYTVTDRRDGSPLFQYLKDELGKGNKIKGRERHLSGAEFLRWLGETQGTNAFYYRMGEKQVTYYPEYIDETSPESSLSPTDDGNWSDPGASKLPEGHNADHELPKQPMMQAKSKPQKSKSAQPRKSTKAKNSTSLTGNAASRPARTKALPRESKPNATHKAKGVRKNNSEALQKQRVGASTRKLRPKRNSKRASTGKATVHSGELNTSNM